MSLAQACFVRSLPPSLACLVCITPSFPLSTTIGFLTPHGTTHTITHKCADSMRRFAMFRYIKRLAMVYLVSQLNATELAEVQLTFQRLNPANPGILVPMELYYAVRQSGHHIKRSEVWARHTCPQRVCVCVCVGVRVALLFSCSVCRACRSYQSHTTHHTPHTL